MKYIPEYEGLYSVTEDGRVWGHKRKNWIRPVVKNNGYLQVQLSKNNHVKYYTVHRLVAITYIPNPNNYPQVNHKDEDKLNNNVSNLEWCDAQYNNTYGTRLQRAAEAHRGIKYNKKVAA